MSTDNQSGTRDDSVNLQDPPGYRIEYDDGHGDLRVTRLVDLEVVGTYPTRVTAIEAAEADRLSVSAALSELLL